MLDQPNLDLRVFSPTGFGIETVLISGEASKDRTRAISAGTRLLPSAFSLWPPEIGYASRFSHGASPVFHLDPPILRGNFFGAEENSAERR
jgi:hypothetical protein